LSPSLKALAPEYSQPRHRLIDREESTASNPAPPAFSASSGGFDGGRPEIQPHQPTSPTVALRLRAVGWSSAGNRSDIESSDPIASVALDLSVVQDSDERKHDDHYPGEQEHGADDYWLFADFDDGAVRLWQVRVIRRPAMKLETWAPEIILFKGVRLSRLVTIQLLPL